MQEKVPSRIIIFILASFAFIIGVTEFVSVGLIPLIANDLNVSLALAGLTVSVYAFAVVFSAPLLTSLFVHFSKKKIILVSVFAQVVGSLLCGFSTNFALLLTARVIASLAHGIFMAIGTIIVTQVVEEDKQSSSVALMFTGFTIATIVGVPLGTFLGDVFGWRDTFFFIAGLGLIVFLLALKYFPNNLVSEQKIPLSSIKSVLFHKDVLFAFLITFIGYGGTFVTFTYLRPLLTEFGGFGVDAISIILFIYGISLAVGNIVGGKWANKDAIKSLFIIFILNVITLLTFYFVLNFRNPQLIVVWVFLLGCFAFMSVPGLQVYAIGQTQKHIDGKIATMGSALNISSFNLGIFSGSYLGEVCIEKLPLDYLPLVGAGMISIAVLISLYLVKKSK